MLESGGPIEFRQGVCTVGVDEKFEKKKLLTFFNLKHLKMNYKSERSLTLYLIILP